MFKFKKVKFSVGDLVIYTLHDKQCCYINKIENNIVYIKPFNNETSLFKYHYYTIRELKALIKSKRIKHYSIES